MNEQLKELIVHAMMEVWSNNQFNDAPSMSESLHN